MSLHLLSVKPNTFVKGPVWVTLSKRHMNWIIFAHCDKQVAQRLSNVYFNQKDLLQPSKGFRFTLWSGKSMLQSTAYWLTVISINYPCWNCVFAPHYCLQTTFILKPCKKDNWKAAHPFLGLIFHYRLCTFHYRRSHSFSSCFPWLSGACAQTSTCAFSMDYWFLLESSEEQWCI